LENLGKLRHDSEVRGPCQLSAFNDDAKIRRSFETMIGPENYTFLVWRGTREEVGLDVQGLISSCALPPITNRTRYTLPLGFPIIVWTDLDAAGSPFTKRIF
jgi:hypothetical protein